MGHQLILTSLLEDLGVNPHTYVYRTSGLVLCSACSLWSPGTSLLDPSSFSPSDDSRVLGRARPGQGPAPGGEDHLAGAAGAGAWTGNYS